MQTGSTTNSDLSKLTVPQLKALCKERCITGYSKLSKAALLEKLGQNGGTTLQSTSVRQTKTVSSKSSGSVNSAVPEVKDGVPFSLDSTPSRVAQETTLLNLVVHPKGSDNGHSNGQVPYTTLESLPGSVAPVLTKSMKRSAHIGDSVPKKRVKFTEVLDRTPSAAVPLAMSMQTPEQRMTDAPAVSEAASNPEIPFRPPVLPENLDMTALAPHHGCTDLRRSPQALKKTISRQPLTREQLNYRENRVANEGRSQHDPNVSTTAPTNTTAFEECHSHLSENPPVSTTRHLDVEGPTGRGPTQRLDTQKRFKPLMALTRESSFVVGQSTAMQPQANTKTLSPQLLESRCFDVPPLANISLPPRLSDRKRVYNWAVILSKLLNEDRKTCCLVSRVLRYAVYLSAAYILSKKYPGHRLDVVFEQYSQKMTNMWPYLRLRDSEVVYRRQAFKESFLGGFTHSLSFDPLSELMWSSPDDARQVEVALRFVLTRMWFAVSIGTYGHDSSAWTRDVVQNVTEVVKGEIWQVDVQSPKAMQVFYVLEATCEVIGHLPGQLQSGPAPSVLRADWSSYILRRSSQGSSVALSQSLSDSITFSNSEDYYRGVSKAWLRRISKEGEIGIAKRHVAERYTLACVVANGVSGRWMSANAMAQEFAGLPESGPSIARSRVQPVNMYLPAHHHVESVHFTTSSGQDLHPALAVVQTTQREYYILRDNGMQVGCEEEGIAEIWMQILHCNGQEFELP